MVLTVCPHALDHEAPELLSSREIALEEGGTPILAGAAGNKLLVCCTVQAYDGNPNGTEQRDRANGATVTPFPQAVAEGRADLTILHFKSERQMNMISFILKLKGNEFYMNLKGSCRCRNSEFNGLPGDLPGDEEAQRSED